MMMDGIERQLYLIWTVPSLLPCGYGRDIDIEYLGRFGLEPPAGLQSGAGDEFSRKRQLAKNDSGCLILWRR